MAMAVSWRIGSASRASGPSTRDELANRQFARWWRDQTVSRFGDGIMSVALPLLVLMTTRSSTDLGLVVAARLVPTVVFLLLGGSLTVRVSRRLAMLPSDVSRAGVGLALGVLALWGRLDLAESLWGASVSSTRSSIRRRRPSYPRWWRWNT